MLTWQLFSPVECARIVSAAGTLPSLPGRVYDSRPGATGPVVDRQQYAATETYLAAPWILGPLRAALVEVERQARDERPFVAEVLGGQPFALVETPRLLRYDNGGHFGWHRDAPVERTAVRPPRRLTGVVQLSPSQGYEGGTLEIEAPGDPPPTLLASRELGWVTIFPAAWRHRVTPVTGLRHALVFWGY